MVAFTEKSQKTRRFWINRLKKYVSETRHFCDMCFWKSLVSMFFERCSGINPFPSVSGVAVNRSVDLSWFERSSRRLLQRILTNVRSARYEGGRFGSGQWEPITATSVLGSLVRHWWYRLVYGYPKKNSISIFFTWVHDAVIKVDSVQLFMFLRQMSCKFWNPPIHFLYSQELLLQCWLVYVRLTCGLPQMKVK